MGALPILGATKGVGQCFKLQFYTFEKLEANITYKTFTLTLLTC